MEKMTRTELVALRRKNLARWIDDFFESQADFVKRFDLNQSEISGLLREKSFGEVKARNLEEACSMPHLYLDTPPEEGVTPPVVGERLVTITQHNDVRGAMGGGLVLSDQPGQITEWKVTREWAVKNIPSNTGESSLRIVTGFGDSMKGMFNSGDPLLIDIGVTSLEFDGVYFFRIGDEGFIKRLQRIPGQGVRVISKNTEYEPWTITDDMDLQILGRVLKVWQGSEF